MFIKKDTIIALTTGVYSDYCLREHVVALKDFDSNEVKQAFLLVTEKDEFGYSYAEQDQFIKYIVENKYVNVLENDEVVELFIGSSGEVELT